MGWALIVVDLIEDYFDASIWPKSDLPRLRTRIITETNRLTHICRSNRVPIVWVCQEFSPDMADAFDHARRAGMRYAIRGSKGAELLAALDVGADDVKLIKKRFSAFHGTDLDHILSGLEVSTLIVAGVTTAWCVRSTVVDAYQRDYEVILATDAMGAFSATAHRESIQAMDGYVATAMGTDAIALKLGG